MKKLIMVLAVLMATAITACRDTTIASWKALGSDGRIKCYSGGQVIFDGESSGKISSLEKSDGWQFMDKATGRLVRVSGTCVIHN
jgi:hypothetical protein